MMNQYLDALMIQTITTRRSLRRFWLNWKPLMTSVTKKVLQLGRCCCCSAFCLLFFSFQNIFIGIAFVKIDDDAVAAEYGVDHIPTLVYFENKIPSLYHGDLTNEEQVLAWLIDQLSSDMIEDITDEMLDKLIKKSAHLAVLFCKYRSLIEAFFNVFRPAR